MHVVLLRFRAHPGREAEYEAAHGDRCTWARYFEDGHGFLESQARRYAELDASCAALIVEETALGTVEA